MLNHVASAGDETTPETIDRLINSAGGAQQCIHVGGAQQIPDPMAKDLADANVLDAPALRTSCGGIHSLGRHREF